MDPLLLRQDTGGNDDDDDDDRRNTKRRKKESLKTRVQFSVKNEDDDDSDEGGRILIPVIVCENCEDFMKSFCDLYNDLKTIELLLHWQVWKFNRTVTLAADEERNPFPDNLLGGCGEKIKKLLELKFELANKCPEKLLKSFPKISLPKLTLNNKIIDLPAESSKELLSTHSITKSHERRNIKDQISIDEDEDDEQESSIPPKRERLISDEDEEREEDFYDDWLVEPAKVEAESDNDANKPSSFLEDEEDKHKHPDNLSKSIPDESIDKAEPPLKKPEDSDSEATTATAINTRRLLRTLHECNICLKTFSTMDRLTNHQETKCSEALEDDSVADDDGSEDKDDRHVPEVEVKAIIDAAPKLYKKFQCPDPDCNKLFDFVRNLLLHHHKWHTTDTESTDTNENVDTIIIKMVSLLSFSKKALSSSSSSKQELTELAKIKVPSKVLPEVDDDDDDDDDDKRLLTCYVCNFNFTSWMNLMKHYKSHHDLNILGDEKLDSIKKCTVEGCPAYFISRTQLFIHLKYQHNDNLDESQLKKLLKESSDLKCKDCGKELSTRSLLRMHRLKFHVDKSTIVKCGKCPHIFETLKDLDWHVQTQHCGRRNHQRKSKTNEEEKTSLTNSSAAAAPKLHRIRKFQCPEPNCNKFFNFVGELLLHRLKSHTGTDSTKETNNEGTDDKVTIKIVSMPKKGFCSLLSSSSSSTEELTELAKIKVPSKILPDDEAADGKLLKCYVCNYKFTTRLPVMKHYKSHHNLNCIGGGGAKKTDSLIKNCTVGDCPAYFNSRTQLFVHLKYQHNHNLDEKQLKKLLKESSELKCKDCGKELPSRGKLRLHRLKLHVDKSTTVKCRNCPNIFETQKDLDWHMQIKHDSARKDLEGEFLCQKCSKLCIGAHGLNCHMRWHEKQEQQQSPNPTPPTASFFCDQCAKTFTTKPRLNRHLKYNHAGPGSWKFQCDICSKRYFNKIKLEEHIRSHSGERPFVCEVCGVKYAHRHNLRIHFNRKHADVMKDLIPMKKSWNRRKKSRTQEKS